MLSLIVMELLVILLLLLVNGVFAMSEIAVVASRKVRLEQRALTGDKGAIAALALSRDPTQFLATVQVGITLIGVLAGAFGGATIAGQLVPMFGDIPLLAPYANSLSLAVVVGGITYLSLIIGELVPKRIALAAPETIAAAIARPMRAISRVTAPMVRVLTGSTNVMLRLLGVRPHAEPGLTEDEIRAVLEQGAEEGIVEAAEHVIVESVFRLGDRNVRSIMTPRPDVEWIDVADARTAVARAELVSDRRGLYLVCEDDIDHVVGFAYAADLLSRCMGGEPIDRAALRAVSREPMYVPSTMPVLHLVEAMRASRQHAAVILDEYGGVEGVVTLHDVLEALIGDLPSGDDLTADGPIVRRDDGSWLVEGAMPIIDVESTLDIELAADDRAEYQTLAGFVLARLGRLPRTGEHVEWRGYRFEVVDMDGRRIDKVLITVPSGAAAGPGGPGGRG